MYLRNNAPPILSDGRLEEKKKSEKEIQHQLNRLTMMELIRAEVEVFD